MTVWLAALLSTAHAGVPVVYDGADPAAVVSTVTARTGLPTSQLDPTALDTLLRASPAVLGNAAIRHCATAPTHMADVQAAAVRAEHAWRDADPAGALDHLDLGIAELGCLVELADPAVAGRMFLLRGGLLAREGQLDAARAELVTAAALLPTVAWDDTLPPEGAPLLAEVTSRVASVALTVAPAGTTSGPWIDGRSVATSPLPLRPGLHLVQSTANPGIRSAWLVVDGDATAVFPASYRRPLLERMRDPAAWPEVAALLRGAIPGFEVGYVASEGGLWLVAVEAGQLATTTVVAPPAVQVATPPTKRGKH